MKKICTKYNQFKIEEYKEKGITLIAIVITIIVLLILAGITISMVTGENGLLKRSSSAVVAYSLGGAKDEVHMKTEEAIQKYFISNYNQRAENMELDTDWQEELDKIVMATITDIQTPKVSIKKQDGKIWDETNKTIILQYDPDKSTVMGHLDKGIIKWDSIKQGEEEEDKRLASKVNIGDYVNYTSNGGNYTILKDDWGGQSNQSFTTDVKKWRVLAKNENTGVVTLIADEPTSSTLSIWGRPGYKNYTTILDNICDTYKNTDYASSARSITLNDIEAYSTYNKNDYIHTGYNNKKYGDTREYNEGGFIAEDGVTIKSAPFVAEQTQYRYEAESYFEPSIYNVIFKKSTDTSTYKEPYFVANRGTALYNIEVNYCIYAINNGIIDSGPNGQLNGTQIYLSGSRSGSTNKTLRAKVMPVIELKANIETTGQDENGAWNI